MRVPTVQIKHEVTDENPHGFIVINESDFDKEKHELHIEAPPPAASDDLPPPPAV